MRKGLLFVFLAIMFVGCTAHVGIPKEDHLLMKSMSDEAAKYCDDALYSFHASLNAGIVQHKEYFYAITESCIMLLREAEARAAEFAGKAAVVSPKDHAKMSCYREHFKYAIEMWERFKSCYEDRNDPQRIRACFQSSAERFAALKRIIWGGCPPDQNDDDSSGDDRTRRFSREQ